MTKHRKLLCSTREGVMKYLKRKKLVYSHLKMVSFDMLCGVVQNLSILTTEKGVIQKPYQAYILA